MEAREQRESGQRPLDEAAVRAALAGAIGPSGGPLGDEDISEIVTEGSWAAVVLAAEQAPRGVLASLYRHLTEALPAAEIEVRAGTRIYRGGAGFGPGKHVVAVLGGKGGVGKSTVAVNLAVTLAAMGLSVGLLDGDINAPDVPHMVGVHPTGAPPRYGWQLWATRFTPPSQWRRPERKLGVELMSVGFVVPERLPMALTGRVLISALLRNLIFEVAWEADVLIIDAPPGTGEELQVMASELPLSGAIFVTTPQDLAQLDAERTLTLLGEHGVPVIGVVQNMAALTCPSCGEEIDLFAQSTRLVDAGVPVLGRIPFDVQLSVTADQGRPLVLGDPRGPIAFQFARIGSSVGRWLATRDDQAAAAD